jgi:hypothetical protein
MRTKFALSLGLLFSLSGCAKDPSNPGVLEDSGQDPDLCDTLLSGVPWGEISDFDPTFEASLNAIDFDALPQSFDISGLLPIFRGGVAYALEIPPAELGDTINRDEALATGHLGRVVVAALSTDDDLGIDYAIFRNGIQRYYTCSRGFPGTLDGFEAAFGAIPEDYTDVYSAAKCATRRLRINPEQGFYVAESLVEGDVRETEILMDSNRADGQLDFAVYGADGMLTDRSQFPTLGGGDHIVTGAPYVCMTCHLNSSADEDTWGYDRLYPTGTGPCAE